MSKRHPSGNCGQSNAKRVRTADENLSKMSCSCDEAAVKKLTVQQEQVSGTIPEGQLPAGGLSNAERYEFEYLKSPLKPTSDKKIYRVIKLKNGLRAILISDITNVQTVVQCKDNHGTDSESESEAGSASEAGSGSEDESGSEEDGSGSEGESGSEDRSQASAEEKDISDLAADDESLRRVNDKLQGSGQEKLAAVGLTVGVGSFSDPDEIPGLAHFLEHMVFMGSVKYPAENHFDSFVKRQGGSDNAHTDCETTTFYFECQEKFLCEGMDKFSQFFSAPLLKKEAMTRERKAVESEFRESLSSDGARWTQLVAGMARAGHPATKFTWGNAETLRRDTTPAKLHRALHDFRRQHYSGHRFTLAVQARLPLEELEMFVAETFSNVPSNYLPADDFSSFTDSYATPEFHRLYQVESAKDTLKLNLTWALPPQKHLYRSKPYDYVEDLLDEEGEGSLLAYLKERLWAFSLHADHSSSGFESNSMHFLFSICIKLTDEGYRNIKQILSAVFGFLRMMRESGPDERYFDERRRMAEARFNYCEESEASAYVEELSEALQNFPPEDCIAGPHLYFEYNPQLIKAFQDELIPEKVNITVLALDKTLKYDKKEKWFNTQYSDEEISAKWLRVWGEADAPPGCHLPGPNPLVPTDFSVAPDPAPTDYPVTISKTPLGQVWYKRDHKFLQPVACFCFYLISPEVVKSATEAVLLDLMSDLLDFQLAGELHPARAADISVAVRPSTNGLSVFLSGFSQNLHSVMEIVFKKLASLEVDNEEVFAEIKLNRAKAYFNTFLAPSKLLSDLRLRVLVTPHWTSVERQAALAAVDQAAVADFVRRYRARLYVQCLAQGNISQAQAMAAADLVYEQLKYQPLNEDEQPKYLVRQIEVGKRVVRAKSFNPKDSISVITNYYQTRLGSIHDICILEVIMVMMEEPLFDRLRTKEQLGYDVSCELRDTHGVLGFTVCITYQEDKRPVTTVDSRIDSFLSRFATSLLRSSDRKLDEALRTVIKLKRCVDVHLREEVNRNWTEVIAGDFLFDRQQRELSMLEKLTTDDIRRWARDWFPGSPEVKEMRELSIQVVGCEETTSEAENGNLKEKPSSNVEKEDGQPKVASAENCSCESDKDKKIEEKLPIEENDEDDEVPSAFQTHDLTLIVEDDSFIGDIDAYRKDLIQFPYHQILQ